MNEDNLESLQQLTLVIPTYNRPHFLARLLNYYAGKNIQLQFLILDSSNEQNKILNKQAVSSLGQRARYFDFPSTITFANKLLEGLKRVETPYCAFCADDDVIFIDGLAKALSFLKNNPSYVCADGIYFNFTPVGQDIQIQVEYATQGIQAEDPGARVYRLYQKYESVFYGVFRARDAINIFSGVCKNDTLHYQELFQATAAMLLGKSHRLPVFYAARQACEAADATRDKWQTFWWFAENPEEVFHYYRGYRDALWSFYQDHALEKKYNKKLFYKLMDISHAVYFSAGCSPDYYHSVFQPMWPQDSYTQLGYRDNVCNQLKNPIRFWMEKKIHYLSKIFPKAVSSIYLLGAVPRLNREIKKKINTPWNCKPGITLRWMVGVRDFRNACLELCTYMGEIA